jgi:hypothetical protein
MPIIMLLSDAFDAFDGGAASTHPTRIAVRLPQLLPAALLM